LRFSEAYIPTQKEIPSDAVIPSHQLMIRSGLVRLLASGVYSYLPLGWRVMQKVMAIIREEMDRIGAQEIFMPVLNPIEIWDETGRNEAFGDEMFRLSDRKGRKMALAPTHEEIICDLARKFVRSYKDMPQIWYQIQTKFRDEPRPRSGVIRARQFFMKDAYSLDSDESGLDQSYQKHAEAYKRIFTRCGLKYHIVGASSGLMGGSSSQEFMLESEFGEDTLILCDSCGYASNLEVATSVHNKAEFKEESLKEVHTPDKRSIEEVSEFLKLPKTQFMKSLLYVSNKEFVMVLLRGDYELNEAKLQQIMHGEIRPAHPDEVKEVCGAEIGFIGPVGLKTSIKIIADLALREQHNLVTGANKADTHLTGLEFKRDVTPEQYIDIRNVAEGEKCSKCDHELKIVQAIELGHIFKLGTKYSNSMKATFLDKNGKANPIIMGSYGIGVERIIAAAIEQNHDDKGIIWEKVLAPFKVHLIALKVNNQQISDISTRLYKDLTDSDIDTLYDDREVSPGFKFKDADLIGIPIQVVIGERGLNDKKAEVKIRKTGEVQHVEFNNLKDTITSILNTLA